MNYARFPKSGHNYSFHINDSLQVFTLSLALSLGRATFTNNELMVQSTWPSDKANHDHGCENNYKLSFM